MNRQFLDFEEPIKLLYEQIEKLRDTSEKGNLDLSASIRGLETKITEQRKALTSSLTSWQKVQLSRHPDRPYTLAYIKRICTDFIELHGDRNIGDDKAIVGGLAKIDGHPVMVIGHQKGFNTKLRQYRNFGMPNPEGYRKALRLMKIAEKFNLPVVTLIDTPGAFPGIEAEERGQGEAIARNIYEMLRLRVPIICVVIGEGASGGALGIGVGDIVSMLENTWFTVISPESCASILWRTWDKKVEAAEQLKLTSKDMKEFGIIDDIIPEPQGGAHWNYDEAADYLKQYVVKKILSLQQESAAQRIEKRILKYEKIGFYNEL